MTLVVLGGGLGGYLATSPRPAAERRDAPGSGTGSTPIASDAPSVDDRANESDDLGIRAGIVDPGERPPPTAPVAGSSAPISVLRVRVEDDWGNRFSEVSAVLLNGGWVALPRRSCLGGTVWRLSSNGEGVIEQGVWRVGDEVGLWRAPGVSEDGIPLERWSGDRGLAWRALDGVQKRESMLFGAGRSHGFFRRIELQENLSQPGVFLEHDAVVGFTFGPQGPGGAWLWQGPALDGARRPDTDVAAFYRLTFAGGREEAFAKAIARSVSSYDRVVAFAQGCRLSPRLVPEDTPPSLTLAQVTTAIKSLLGTELRGVNASSFLALLDVSVLVEAGDAELLVFVAAAEYEKFGAAGALELLHGAGPALLRPGSPTESLATGLEQKIYDEWLQSLVNDGHAPQGWAVYREATARFPRDPLIHLRGAQLALLAHDWREAERILFAREYPVNLSDLVRVIQADISRLKGQEGKIVIRFEPGANLIPTSAVLNGRFEQNFMVDTGATRTTIPHAVAERLGLRTHTAPRVRVSTAGGIIQAAAVTLDSMTLGGWEVPNVDVLVLDLPGTPDLGLIGLNFLNQFRMDLKIEEGILVLEPR